MITITIKTMITITIKNNDNNNNDQEEQKAKLLEPNKHWGQPPVPSVQGEGYSYQVHHHPPHHHPSHHPPHHPPLNCHHHKHGHQNQLQSMWQQCWNQNSGVTQVIFFTFCLKKNIFFLQFFWHFVSHFNFSLHCYNCVAFALATTLLELKLQSG